MNTFQKRFVVMVFALLLTGSSSFADKTKQIDVKVPNQYAESPAQGVAKDMSSLVDWWNNFHDPELQSLVKRAIAGNLDLQVARAKLREARATLSNTQLSNQVPTINMKASYAYSKTSTDSPLTPTLSGGSSSVPLIPSTYGLYETYFDASYEVDIFGGVRNKVKAARADAAASEEDLRNTLVSTVAEIARDYIQLRQYQEQLRVTKQNAVSQQDTLTITKVRNKAGLVSDLDVANATASLASTESSIPTLERQIRQEIHAIAVMLGEAPAEVAKELASASGLPVAPVEVPVGLPSELLRRRPDIREAERNVEAAAARVGVQKAKMFPTLTLTAQSGGQSENLMNLLNAAARFYSVGPTIEWGLLNYPALKANIRTYKAKEDQQILSYRKTVLTALQDVEDALVAYDTEGARQQVLEKEVEEYRRASSLALTKYTRGLSNFLDVLDAQRSLYSAEDALAQCRAAVLTDVISLYKALGGGWETVDPMENSLKAAPGKT